MAKSIARGRGFLLFVVCAALLAGCATDKTRRADGQPSGYNDNPYRQFRYLPENRRYDHRYDHHHYGD